MGIELARAYITIGANTQAVVPQLNKMRSESNDALNPMLADITKFNTKVGESAANAINPMMAGIVAFNGKVASSVKGAVQKIPEEFAKIDFTEVQNPLIDIKGTLSEIGGTATIMGGLVTAAFASSARSAVMAAGQYEQTMIAFSTMMGSGEKASKLLGDLTTFAAKTPFEMPEIEQVARGLIMFGEDSRSLMQTLELLGNAASGTSSNFGMIGLVFNQIRGVGKLLTQDFRQLSTRGVISLQDIANHYKITTAAAQDMLSKGKISFEDFRGIMLGLTTGSGRFANMMEKQSQSMIGLLSTFSDAWRIALRQVGEELVPVAKMFVKVGISAVSMFEGIDSVSKKMIAGTLGIGAALGMVTVSVAGMIFAGTKLITVYTSASAVLASYAATSTWAANAQRSLNVAMAASPWILLTMAGAVATLVGYNLGRYLADSTEKAKQLNKVLAEQKTQLDFGGKTFSVAGTDQNSIQQYIESTEQSIFAAKQHLKEMESQWFGSADAIELVKDTIISLEDRLAKAKTKMDEFVIAGGVGPEMDKQIEDAAAKTEWLRKEIVATQARMADDQEKLRRYDRVKSKGGNKAAADEARSNYALHEKLLAQRNQELEHASELEQSLREKRVAAPAEVEEKATEKIKQQTEELEKKVATWNMTSIEAAKYQMELDKVAEKEREANLAQLERVNVLKIDDIIKKYKDQAAAIGLTRDEAYLLGLMQDKSLTMTAESLQKIKTEINALRLKEALEGMAPPAQRLQEQFAGIARQFGAGSQQYATMARSMSHSLIMTLNPVAGLGDEVRQLDVRLNAGSITMTEYSSLLRNTIRGFGGASDPLDELRMTIDGLSRQFGTGSKLYGEFAFKLGQGVRDTLDPHKQLRMEVERLNMLQTAGAFVGDEYRQAMQNLGRSVREGLDPFLRYKDQVDELEVKLRSGIITQDEYNASVRNMGRSTRESINPFARYQSQVAELQAQIKAGAISRQEYDAAIRNMGQSVREQVNPLASYASRMQELNALLKIGAINQWEYGEAARQARVSAGLELGPGRYGFKDIGSRFQDILLKPGLGPMGAKAGEVPKDRQGDVVRLLEVGNKKQDQLVEAIKANKTPPMRLE